MKKLLLILLFFLSLAGATGCKKDKDEEVNETSKAVSESLDRFYESTLNYYVEKKEFEFHLIKMLDVTNKIDDYLSISEATSYVNTLITEGGISNYYKSSIISKAYNLDTTNLKEAVNSFSYDVNQDYSVYNLPYLYLTYEDLNINSSIKDEIITKSNSFTKEELDSLYFSVDTAAMYLMIDNEQLNKNVYYQYVNESLKSNGIDNGYGVNVCSTAYVIMGLLKEGFDPNNYTYNDVTYKLVDSLLAMENEGKFYSNNEVDYSFSIPQGFLALALYKDYCEKNNN